MICGFHFIILFKGHCWPYRAIWTSGTVPSAVRAGFPGCSPLHVHHWLTVDPWVNAARPSSATAKRKGCDCHNPHPRTIDALCQQPWEWPFRSLLNPFYKWFLRDSQCTINLSSLTPPKCQAGKDTTSSSILKPGYPKRLKWRLWKTAISLQVKSCHMAFRTENPKASGVWKVATEGKSQHPLFISLASVCFGKASGRLLRGTGGPCVWAFRW